MCGVGFVAQIGGQRSRAIVEQGLDLLARLSHRAACGSDPETGDGAGIQLQLPDAFFRREADRLGFDLPPNRRFAVGQVFLPPDPAMRAACEAILAHAIEEAGQRVLGWRDVPVDPSVAGAVARDAVPVVRQLYVPRAPRPPA